ncbi:SigB/SigF/SigG family RNA polymerase sigma factor [Haloechinothrix sp. LS1_15]|uniref:SigB/SigF/SigG family RNA polymerase sigma factor n=1 Tax=Haloechinothrix sp. LS1_15 TaxID=2652248 RepID=UPI00294AFD9C|nr:SigB/SigF/SigG family RNA polymerase sigma factor [Haloechinothrix sp. LS1_15]
MVTTNRHHAHEYDHLAPLFDELVGLAADDPRRAEIRKRLVTGYLPVAEHVAQRFSGRGSSREDLQQVATVGLINAIDRFDPARGADFLSYAVPTVMGEVRRYFRDSSWSLRVPRRLKELHRDVAEAGSTLAQRIGRAPTPTEIARHLDLSREEVCRALDVARANHPISLDEPPSGADGDRTLAEAVGDEDGGIDSVEHQQALQPLLRQLPVRERRILGLRFVDNLTQTQIAERVGLSQMHVSRLLGRSLAWLREGLRETEQRPRGGNGAQ